MFEWIEELEINSPLLLRDQPTVRDLFRLEFIDWLTWYAAEPITPPGVAMQIVALLRSAKASDSHTLQWEFRKIIKAASTKA